MSATGYSGVSFESAAAAREMSIPRRGPSRIGQDPWFLARGFLPVPNICFTYWLPKLENREFVLLMALLSSELDTPQKRIAAEETVTITRSLDQLRELTGLDREAIHRASAGLEKRTLLEVKTTRRRANEYVLSLSRLMNPKAPVGVGNADSKLPVGVGNADSKLPVGVGNAESGIPTTFLKKEKTENKAAAAFEEPLRNGQEVAATAAVSSPRPVLAISDDEWRVLLDFQDRWSQTPCCQNVQIGQASAVAIKAKLVAHGRSFADLANHLYHESFAGLSNGNPIGFLIREAEKIPPGESSDSGPPAHLLRERNGPKCGLSSKEILEEC